MPLIVTADRAVASVTATESDDWEVVSTPTGYRGITSADFSDNDYVAGFCIFENGEDYEIYDTEDDSVTNLLQVSNISGTVTIARPATPYKSSNGGNAVSAGNGTHTLVVGMGAGTAKRLLRETNPTTLTLSSGDATPSVAGYRFFKTAGTTTITSFDDMESGKGMFIVRRGDSDITIADGTNISLPDDEDITLTTSEPAAIFVEDGGVAYLVARTGSSVLDEDDFASDSETKAPSQQSVKAYLLSTTGPQVDTDLLSRTLLDRIGDEINVLDYFQDDEAAIVARIKARTSTSSDAAATDAAIDAAYAAATVGDSIVLPQGLYCTTSTHNFEKNYFAVIFQPGARIEHYGDTDCLVFRPSTYATTAAQLEGPEVHNAFITRGDNATTLVAGIRFVKCNRGQIIRPRIYHFPIRVQIEGGQFNGVDRSQFRNAGPGISSQNYIAGSRLIGLTSSIYNDGSDRWQPCYSVTISNFGWDGVNVDYGIYIEDSDGLAITNGYFAVFKKAQLAIELDDDESSVHQINISNVYFDGGVTPHSTPHNILVGGSNRTSQGIGTLEISNSFIGNDTDGDDTPIKISRLVEDFILVGTRHTTCVRELIDWDTGQAGGNVKLIGCTFRSLDTGEAAAGAAMVFDSVESLKMIGCSFDTIPSAAVKLADSYDDIASVTAVGNSFIDATVDIDYSGVTITDWSWTGNTSDASSPEPDTGGAATIETITPRFAASGGGPPTYATQTGKIVWTSDKTGTLFVSIELSALNSLSGAFQIVDTGLTGAAINSTSTAVYGYGMAKTDVVVQLGTVNGNLTVYAYDGTGTPAALTAADLTDRTTLRFTLPFVLS